MVNNSQIISVSAPKKLVEWLEGVELSASEIFQTAVLNKMNEWERYNNDIGKFRRINDTMQTMIQEYNSFIDETEQRSRFNQWKKDKDVAI